MNGAPGFGRFRCPACGHTVIVPPDTASFAVCRQCAIRLPVRDGIIALAPPDSDRDYPHELVDLVSAVEDRHFWFAARTDVIRSVLQQMPRGAGATQALDIGCGNGLVMAALERAGLSMSGIDMHWSALSRARRRVRGALYCSTASPLPFFADFALVTLCDVIEHVEDDAQVLAEAGRVLVPRGYAIVTVPAGPALWSAYDEVIGHKRRYDREALVAALARANFDVRFVRYFNFPLILAGMARRFTGRRRAAAAGSGLPIVRKALRVPSPPLNAMLRWAIRAEAPLRRLAWMRGGSLIALAQRRD